MANRRLGGSSRFSTHDKRGISCYRCGAPSSCLPLTEQDGVSVCRYCLYRISKRTLLEINGRDEPDLPLGKTFGGRTG